MASDRDRPSEASGRERREAPDRDRAGRLPSEVRRVATDRPDPSEASGQDRDRPLVALDPEDRP